MITSVSSADYCMNTDSIKKLFEQVKRGKVSPDEAVQQLRHLPFEDLGFANVDHHRSLRVGMAEVIFGPGKEPLQLAEIFAKLAQRGNNVLSHARDRRTISSGEAQSAQGRVPSAGALHHPHPR